MKRYTRLLVTLVILMVGVALVPFIAFPKDRIEWQVFSGLYEPSADVWVSKGVSDDLVRLGDKVTYSVVIRNDGPSVATGVVLEDWFAETMDVVSVVSTHGSCSGSRPLLCNLGTMTPGIPAFVTIVVEPTTPGGFSNYAYVYANETDPVTGNNHASAYHAVEDCYAQVSSAPTIIHETLQPAVDAAGAGDTIKVAGYCMSNVFRNGARQMAYIDKDLTIRGGYLPTNWTTSEPDTNPTTLDAFYRARVLFVSGSIDVNIENLIFEHAHWSGPCGSGPQSSGGAICIEDASATIQSNQINDGYSYGHGGGIAAYDSPALSLLNNKFTNNYSYEGGGARLVDSQVTVTGNTFESNDAHNTGGGLSLMNSTGDVSYNEFILNWTGGWGGGFFLDSSPVTANYNIVGANYAGQGGGVGLRSSDATLAYNIITGNEGTSGGGVIVAMSPATFKANVVRGNEASIAGGGFYLTKSSGEYVNNVVGDNSAGWYGSGWWIEESTPTLVHTTVTGNTGGEGSGIRVATHGLACGVTMANAIISGHNTGIIVDPGCQANVDGVLWYGNTSNTSGGGTSAVTNEHTGDPAFAVDGYHLAPASAAIDNGVDAGVLDDLDGDSRPQGAGPDLGADEFSPDQADLSVTKVDAPDPAAVGETLTYLVTVRNNGPAEAPGVMLTDTLPAGIVPDSVAPSQGSCAGTSTITCDLGSLPVGASATVIVVVTPKAEGTIENTAATTSDKIDPVPGNNTAIEETSIILGTSDVVDPGTGASLVYPPTGTPDIGVEIPSGAVDGPVTLAYTPISTPSLEVPPNFAFAGIAFSLGVFSDGVEMEGYAFNTPIAVTVHYDPDNLGGATEEALLLFMWNGSSWVDAATTCVPPSVYDRHPGENWLSVDLCHLTDFMLAQGRPRVLLPLILKNH